MLAESSMQNPDIDILIQTGSLHTDGIPTNPFAKDSVFAAEAKRFWRGGIGSSIISSNRHWTWLRPYTSITSDLYGRHEKDEYAIDAGENKGSRCKKKKRRERGKR